MRFRLTYEGDVRPTGRDPVGQQKNPLAQHKHVIRSVFHRQLKRLWETDRFLKEAKIARLSQDGDFELLAPHSHSPPLAEVLADEYKEFGYRFVPLVNKEFSLLCSLHILFLQRDDRQGVTHAGDLDNRIKTIIDALRKPQNQNELAGHSAPSDGEDPFYVLLEDDNLVSHLEVETDALLEPPINNKTSQSYVHLVITAKIHPYYVTNFNLGFAG